MIFPKQPKWRKGVLTNGTDLEELTVCIKYEEKLQNFSIKRKYGVDNENCLPQELDKALRKLFI